MSAGDKERGRSVDSLLRKSGVLFREYTDSERNADARALREQILSCARQAAYAEASQPGLSGWLRFVSPAVTVALVALLCTTALQLAQLHYGPAAVRGGSSKAVTVARAAKDAATAEGASESAPNQETILSYREFRKEFDAELDSNLDQGVYLDEAPEIHFEPELLAFAVSDFSDDEQATPDIQGEYDNDGSDEYEPNPFDVYETI